MPRPSWSGQVQISLVSFGVDLFPAIDATSDIAFHEIDRKTGERIRHQNVTDTGPVNRGDIVKGYEVRKGEYVAIEPEEVEDLRLESKHTFDIVQFVDVAEIDARFYEKPYFVVPQNESQTTAFAVIRKALQDSGRAGLGEITFGGREHLVALMSPPDEKMQGLMAYALRYATELRDPSEYFAEIKNVAVDASQLDLAKDLIERSTSKFAPSKFVDDYEAALKELVDAKVKNKHLPKKAATPKKGKVIDLMDALRRSVARNASPNASFKSSKGKSSRGNERGTATAKAKHKRQGPTLVKGPSERHKTA